MIDLLTPVKQMVATMTYECRHRMRIILRRSVLQLQPRTNVSTNGMTRQYVPKGRYFITLKNEEVQLIQDKLNHRPR